MCHPWKPGWTSFQLLNPPLYTAQHVISLDVIQVDFRNARLKVATSVYGVPWVPRRKLNSGGASILSSLATLRHFRGADHVEVSAARSDFFLCK